MSVNFSRPAVSSRRKHLLNLGIAAVIFALTVLFYWKIALTGQILTSYDLFAYFYPLRAYVDQSLGQGRLPFWNPYLFGGAPFLANIQTAIFYPFNLATVFLDPPRAVSLSIVVHVFLGGLFMYALARASLTLPRLGAFVAGVVFAFSGFLSSQVGHVNQLNVSIWLPLLFLLFDRAYHRKSLSYILLGGLVLGIQTMAGHPQETFLSLVGLAIFALHRVPWMVLRAIFTLNPLKVAQASLWSVAWVGGVFVGLVLTGLGLAAFQLLPTLELSGESIRSGGLPYREASSFSLPPWEVLRSLFPTFIDNPFSEYVAYVGIIPLALGALAVRRGWRHPYTPLALTLMVVALFFAFGGYNPLYERIYDYLPGLNLFRVPARWLYLYTFGAAMLSGIGMAALEQGRVRRGISLRRAFGAALVLALGGTAIYYALTLLPYTMLTLPPEEVRSVWGVLLFVGVLLNLLAGLPVHRTGLALVTTLLILGELFFAGRDLDLNHPVPPEAYTSLRPVITQLMLDKDDYRILSMADANYVPGDAADLRFIYRNKLSPQRIDDLLVALKYREILSPNLPLTYGIGTIDGYDGGVLPLKNYADYKGLILTSGGLRPNNGSSADVLLRYQLADLPDSRLLGAANVKYVILDKMFDPWVDGVYYDLGSTVIAEPGEDITMSRMPSFQATSLGLVSYLLGSARIPEGTPVARVRITDSTGEISSYYLRVGVDTAEGPYDLFPQVSHPKARVASAWRDDPRGFNYYTRLSFPRPTYVRKIEVEYLLPEGHLYLKGASLIDDRILASASLTPNERFIVVQNGDLKLYQNLDWLPRAYIVHEALLADDLQKDIVTLLESPQRRVILSRFPAVNPVALASTEALLAQPPTKFGYSADPVGEEVSIIKLAPEKVSLQAKLKAPGYLVLADAYYPGWKAMVDGAEVEVLQANFLFKAIFLSPGEHQVEFTYQPASFELGWRISALTLGLMLGLWLLGRLWLFTMWAMHKDDDDIRRIYERLRSEPPHRS